MSEADTCIVPQPNEITPSSLHNCDSLRIVRVLRHDPVNKCVILHAKFSGEEDAVVILEKTTFPSEPEEILKQLKKQTVTSTNNSAAVMKPFVWQWAAVMHNDIYYKYLLQFSPDCPDSIDSYQLDLSNMKATLIHPATQKHLDKYSAFDLHIVRETPEVYHTITRPHYSQQQFSLDWVYNVLKGTAEVDRVLFRNDDFIITQDYKWDGKMTEDLYCLAIVTDKTLHSIRELRGSHLPILRGILNEGREFISSKYSIAKSRLRCYFHYQPTFYHLHVHMVPTNSESNSAIVGRAHLLQQVIENLEKNGNHYAEETLFYQVADNDPLYVKFKDSALDILD